MRTFQFSSDAGLSYFHNPGSEPLYYLTIGQLSSRAAKRWPDNNAFVSVLEDTRFTFKEVDEQATKLAAGLLDLGLMPGDRVGLCSPNSYEWFLALIASAKAGLIMVSMNPSYMAHEIEYCLQKVGVKALITDESYKTQHYYKMMCDIVPGLSTAPENSVVSCNKLPELSYLIVLSENSLPGAHRFCDILERTNNNHHRVHQLQTKLRPEDTAVIQFTSGTTGGPKAVPLTHFAFVNNSYFYGKRLGFDKKSYNILAQSPFFHVLGFVGAMLPSLIYGVTLVLPSRTFSASHSAEAIKKEKCTMLIGTPTMFLDLCAYVDRVPAGERSQYLSPELALSGGAICSAEQLRKIKKTFSGKVLSAYGLTEATGATFQSTLEDNDDLITKTVGKVSEHMEAKVVDADGCTVPMGMAGELLIRSYSNMTGYWEDQKNTDEMLTKDGWLKTGDKFIMMENGYGQVVGRIKEMIIRGGENISPKEIEEFLVTHPDIVDAQVYGMPSERLGEEVGCSLRLAPGAQLSEQEVKDFCKGEIAYFKIPKYVEFLEEFPKTGSGKVQKFKLREAAEKKLGLKKFSSEASLSYLHNPGTEPLHYLTIGQLSSRAAQRWPDTEVFVSVQDSKRLTFSQADLQASQLAAGFLELGLVPGDRIGICSPNSTQWFLTAVAAAKAGLILVSMNPAYMAHDIEYCMQKVGIRAIVTDESYKVQNYYKMICDIVPGLASMPVNSAISCNRLPDFSFLIVNSEKSFPGAYRFCDVLDTTDCFQTLQEVNKKLRPEQNANIQLTSGTTGKPKAVPLTHFNLINSAYCFGKRLGMYKKHYKILAQSPFFHTLGYVTALLASLNFGSTIVLPSPTFSMLYSSEAIKKEKCSMLVGTPTMYVDLCSYVTGLSPEEQLLHQSPEVAVSGGALCSPELLRKMKTTFSCDKVVSAYGLTETTAMCFQSAEENSEYHITSTVGKICEHVEAKVVGPDGKTVPMGETGELWLRSFNNMAGYWEDPQGTTNILTRDNWIKTGDKFVLMADGYGQVVGRMKDMIIRGGENISPREVEDCLATHPDILEAQVYGVFSERLGEEVGCSLRLKPGAQISEQEVKDFCKGKIAYFKIPKYVEVLKEFPKTGSGKIQKFKIREAMEKTLGLKK